MTRRAAEVRLDSLLRTACEVIVERGLANTRTADVAQAAGVSQALVFYHFATKERLLAQAFAYAAEQDMARLDAVVRSARDLLPRVRLAMLPGAHHIAALAQPDAFNREVLWFLDERVEQAA